jgi:hypothetical protein
VIFIYFIYLFIYFFLWVPVGSTSKVSCCRVRDLGSNLAYTKNQLVSWPGGKNNHHETDVMNLNAKKKVHFCLQSNPYSVWCLELKAIVFCQA